MWLPLTVYSFTLRDGQAQSQVSYLVVYSIVLYFYISAFLARNFVLENQLPMRLFNIGRNYIPGKIIKGSPNLTKWYIQRAKNFTSMHFEGSDQLRATGVAGAIILKLK